MLFVSSLVLPCCIFISHLLLIAFLLFIPTKCCYNECGSKHRAQSQHCQGSGGCRSKSCTWVIFWPNLINYVGCFFVFFVIIKVSFCCHHYHHFVVTSLKVIIDATQTLVVILCKPTQMELTIVEICKALFSSLQSPRFYSQCPT